MLPSVSRSIFDLPPPRRLHHLDSSSRRRRKRPLRVPLTRDWFGDAIVLTFLVAQLLDFVFTYLGVALSACAKGIPCWNTRCNAGARHEPRHRQARGRGGRLDAAPVVVPSATRGLTTSTSRSPSCPGRGCSSS